METQLHNYEIKECKIKEVANSMDLLIKHWNESARNKELMVLKPDYSKYEALEASGITVSLAAYLDGKLIGYSVNFLQPHLHYSELMCGYNDLLYVDDAHRNSSVGLRLIRETVKELRARGAKLMLWHAKVDTKLSNILPKVGCKVQEIIYSQEL